MNTKKYIEILIKHLKFIILTGMIWSIYFIFKISCPFYVFWGIICPTCGVTRAIIALLSGDIESYLSMQPMAIPLIVAVVIGLHLKLLNKTWKYFGTAYIITVVLLNLLFFILNNFGL